MYGCSLSPIFGGTGILKFVGKSSNAFRNTKPDKILVSLVLS